MNTIVAIASKEIGVKEIPGQEHCERIIQYAKEAGFEWVNDDETPWCSIFASWAAMKAGLERCKEAEARKWLNVGKPISTFQAKRGDMVIFWSQSPESWQGHVAIFLGLSANKQRIMFLGGNQSNSVSISSYPMSRLLGFRRLRSVEPSVIIEIGNRGIKSFHTYQGAISDYLAAKEEPEFYQDTDRFTKYPVAITAPSGEVLEAFIQDVEQTITRKDDQEYFELDVILLTKNLGRILHIQTNCVGPKGCTEIEWDSIKCAWDLCN